VDVQRWPVLGVVRNTHGGRRNSLGRGSRSCDEWVFRVPSATRAIRFITRKHVFKLVQLTVLNPRLPNLS
jgi:hypothetical protein